MKNPPQILEEVIRECLGVDVAKCEQQISVDWRAIDEVVESLDELDLQVLRMRYVEKLTFQEMGDRFPDVSKGNGKPKQKAEKWRQSLRLAFNKLRHPSRRIKIESAIDGSWKMFR